MGLHTYIRAMERVKQILPLLHKQSQDYCENLLTLSWLGNITGTQIESSHLQPQALSAMITEFPPAVTSFIWVLLAGVC